MMEKFLQSTKTVLRNLSKVNLVHVVIGNEACDLDSTAAALSYAYYLCKKRNEETSLFLPVLNIRENEFRLRTDTSYFLSKLNISPDLLTFRDQLNLFGLKEERILALTLVDYNVMTGKDAALDECVVSVFDHHVRERSEDKRVAVKLATVGSCCTLVAEELLNDTDFHLDDQIAQLLYGTILVDTINRSPAAGKTTERDEEVLTKLAALLPSIKGDNLFQELQTARFDIKGNEDMHKSLNEFEIRPDATIGFHGNRYFSNVFDRIHFILAGLTNMEIFEKDLKMVSGPSMNIAMTSVTMDMQELLGRPGLKEDLDVFCESKSADVVVIMTSITDSTGSPIRHLAVYALNRIFRDQILEVLIGCRNPDLDLEDLNAKIDNLRAFHQKTVTASRKKVLPILKTFVTQT